MADESLRPYVVELSSRENDQRRRVTVEASSREEAAALMEARENEYAQFRLDDPRTIAQYPLWLTADSLAEAEHAAIYIPRDTDMDGRFVRAGKVLRARGDHSGRNGHPLRMARGRLALHHQEKPYRIDRVGDPSITNAVTAALYGLIWQDQIEGSATIVWASDTIKCALLTAYSADFDTHDFFNDVSATEITGTGYTAGGATLGSKTSTYDTASDQIRLDAADPSWTTSTLSATDAVVYKSTGTAATSPLMAGIDFGATVSTTAGTFQITFDSTGIIVFDVT